jgi:hypothetical protein
LLVAIADCDLKIEFLPLRSTVTLAVEPIGVAETLLTSSSPSFTGLP